MFEKDLRLSLLLDTYGEVLDEHTRSVMMAYYDDDLSLAEVAELVGISRQGVRHLIKKGEEQLRFLEDKLGLVKRLRELLRAAELISDASCRVAALSAPDREEILSSLNSAAEIVLNKNG